jgi:hypothetical protein
MGDFRGEFQVIAQVGFRLLSVAFPELGKIRSRDGFPGRSPIGRWR